MTDNIGNSQPFSDDMAEYLQTFLDETEEQLDDLVETMLSLESDPGNQGDLNEAFRLIHSIKGSAGMMGLDSITMLTHHLENRFERIRSGSEQLSEPTMNIVLRCIDFLRQCSSRLRDGEPLGSAVSLLDDLKRLEAESSRSASQPAEPGASTAQDVQPPVDTPAAKRASEDDSRISSSIDDFDSGDAIVCMRIRFRAGLQLADLKAQLIVARLSSLGELRSTHPHLDQLCEVEHIEEFELRLETQEERDRLRAAADVDGVESIEFAEVSLQDLEAEQPQPAPAESLPAPAESLPAPEESLPAPEESPQVAEKSPREREPLVGQSQDEPLVARPHDDETISPNDPTPPVPPTSASEPRDDSTRPLPTEATESSGAEKSVAKVAETMRVDIDRLDKLMNLAGELVVNRARFVQITGQISPARRKAGVLNRIRDFSDGLRLTIDRLESDAQDLDDRGSVVRQLRAGLELMDEHSEIWENDRRYIEKIAEAIDQLTRVSHGLQQGVLDTRMVAVGPLFNRFKRVVRDLSKERGKNVDLRIRGEKTELDKRMIDELGDPLVHLVRNSIDHGLESPDVRAASGKPEVGTIYLEASHSGNNVYVHVRDDGGGIDVARVKAKLVDRQMLSQTAADDLTDEQALDYIWHPGFSTAKEVTDVSGRGVGMDVVKTRISGLTGTIDIDSSPLCGTTFTIRLPLTLAIINCLLVRLRGVVFSMPIDGVREIVSVKPDDVVTVQGKHVFDVRDEFIPLASIDHVFHWHGVDYGHDSADDEASASAADESFGVVILQHAGQTMGLRVDELLGSQDMVIKSLSENFMKVGGLSGASILGDGSVCLMLDVARVIAMAINPSAAQTEELAT